MPIDLVIDERETGPTTKAEGLPGDSNNNANRSNADSASHTDGASTPEVVSHFQNSELNSELNSLLNFYKDLGLDNKGRGEIYPKKCLIGKFMSK